MSILPSLTPKQMLSLLLKAGFHVVHQKGSHIRLEHLLTRKSTTVVMHTTDLSRRMVRMILNQAGISIKELLALLKK